MLKQYGLRCGLKRSAKLRDIRKAIDSGCPVLVTMYEGAHYATVYGYSETHVYVVDGREIEKARNPSLLFTVKRTSMSPFSW